MYFYIMGKDYRKLLPSGHGQQQGGDSGVRQESPRQQDKPDVILPVINSRAVGKAHVPLYDRKEYERRVKAVLEGNILESTIRETADMLGRQIELLNGIPLDVLRNNSNKLVNQDMVITPLEDINRNAENALHEVAGNIHDSSLMKRYVEELTKKDINWKTTSPITRTARISTGMTHFFAFFCLTGASEPGTAPF